MAAVPGPNVRYRSEADILGGLRDVRFTPKSGHWLSASGCLLCARSGPMHCTDFEDPPANLVFLNA